ncbi:MAG: C40 family peptidase, partial [Nocardioides sp.]
PEPASDPTAEPTPEPTPDPVPAPAPQPPAPASGASGAIAFARAQVGEPYRWGAAGPSAWDCSGLTMGAWAAGGKSLPHYSVAQYDQATPISAGQLQPGDLVFWGSSSSPSSIYHVALYVGNGTIIHAPRTGRPVTEESMYYWIPPNFHARP